MMPETRTDVYQDVTDRMIAALERGTVPWHQPWSASSGGRPRSMSTGRPYSGINTWLLGLAAFERGYTSPWWGTFKQIKELGGMVRKGQNAQNGSGATHIVFWKTFTPKDAQADPDTGEIRQRAVARLYSVFNADQTEGLPERYYPQQGSGPVPAESAEDVIGAFLTAPGAPGLEHDGGSRAFYKIGPDEIHLPQASSFESAGHYYATAYHELAHSTGHPSRLDIPESGGNHFGDGKYSREELRAEMTAAYLCAETGLDSGRLFDNSASYIASWLGELRNDRKLVISAAAAAQKAADLVLEPSRQPVLKKVFAEVPPGYADLPGEEREAAAIRLARQFKGGLEAAAAA